METEGQVDGYVGRKSEWMDSSTTGLEDDESRGSICGDVVAGQSGKGTAG